MKNLLAAFARNTVFANIVLVLIFIAGGIATLSMIRENFPEFSLDMITISVPYPGADPEEVEEGISQKIEEAVEGLEGIKQYTTESSENIGTTIIEVKKDYDISDVLDRVRSKVNAISTFPGICPSAGSRNGLRKLKTKFSNFPKFLMWQSSVPADMKSASRFPNSDCVNTG